MVSHGETSKEEQAMTSPFRFGAMLRRTIIAAVAVLPSAGPAKAQKQGGSITRRPRARYRRLRSLESRRLRHLGEHGRRLLFDT